VEEFGSLYQGREGKQLLAGVQQYDRPFLERICDIELGMTSYPCYLLEESRLFPALDALRQIWCHAVAPADTFGQ
jgi:hypothetical protein